MVEPLLVELPNRLGVGMEEEAAVVELVGLLAIKENAGFGAAAESVEKWGGGQTNDSNV